MHTASLMSRLLKPIEQNVCIEEDSCLPILCIIPTCKDHPSLTHMGGKGLESRLGFLHFCLFV